jgi:hypothetical protein
MAYWTVITQSLSRVGMAAWRAYERWVLSQQPLHVTLEPFDDPEMLRAFSVSLKNTTSDRLRLDAVFIRIPENSEFAINWPELLIVLGGPAPSHPWERSRNYAINRALDPGDVYRCEIGIPAGFAISASRKPPVTISVSLTTFGVQERKLVQDIQRNIAL